MKFDSPLFDRIRVKPSEDRRARPDGPCCEWKGCNNAATHRAPKARPRENEHWRFCLEHVREYNHSYNYFSGMSDDAVLKYQKDAITGHRPTWKMGTGNHPGPELGPDAARDPFNVFREFGTRAKPAPAEPPRARLIRSSCPRSPPCAQSRRRRSRRAQSATRSGRRWASSGSMSAPTRR